MTVLGGCGGDDDNPPPPVTYSISGAVSGAIASGVPVNLTGSSTASTTTDGSGNFSFTGLANGSYTVMPSKSGYAFTPVSTPVTVNGANVTGVNFTAARTSYDNASLNGDYLIMVTEVYSTNTGPMTYCDHAGTISFNGAGSATLSGASRCSDGTTVTTTSSEPDPVNYSVNADGSFTINGSGPKPLHGQIALDGSSLLLDGTMQGTSVNGYLYHGVAMKQVTAGTPPTYTNASLNGDYLIMLTEVFDGPGTMTYCDHAGTLGFNGAGSVTVNGESRCSDGATVTTPSKTETVSYSVNADGSFTIVGSGWKPLHGQIALDGSSLLLDGTVQGTSVNDYLDNGVAMKRITAGTPPTYTNASLNGDYLIMLTEVYDDAGTMTYCDHAGTLSFNGAGSVIVNGESRCSDGATVTTPSKIETVSYSVNADGSFTINASGPKPLHGQIALDESSILLDGTMQGTSVNDYLNHGVAMKR